MRRTWALLGVVALLGCMACTEDVPPTAGVGDGDPTRDAGDPGACTDRGCACEPGTPPRTCYLPPRVVGDVMVCNEGEQYCNGGEWSACQGVREFHLAGGAVGVGALISGPDACNPCNPNCSVSTDEPNGADLAVGVNTDGNLVYSGVGTPGLRLVAETTVIMPDTDGDGVPDVAYDPATGTTVVVDACPGVPGDPGFLGCPDDGSEPQIFHNLDFLGDTAIDPLTFSIQLNKVDVYFLIDTTGSMGEEIANIQASLTSGTFLGCTGGIIGAIECTIPDVEFGVGYFQDYPARNPYAADHRRLFDYGISSTDLVAVDMDYWQTGGDYLEPAYAGCDDDAVAGFPPLFLFPDIIETYPSDSPYTNVLSMTNVAGDAQAAIDSLAIGDGLDLPESHTQALYAAVTGSGLSDSAITYVPAAGACAAGRAGYPCFRDDAIPIFIVVTDAPMHNGPNLGDDYRELSGAAPTGGFAITTDFGTGATARALGWDPGTGYREYTIDVNQNASALSCVQLGEWTSASPGLYKPIVNTLDGDSDLALATTTSRWAGDITFTLASPGPVWLDVTASPVPMWALLFDGTSGQYRAGFDDDAEYSTDRSTATAYARPTSCGFDDGIHGSYLEYARTSRPMDGLPSLGMEMEAGTHTISLYPMSVCDNDGVCEPGEYASGTVGACGPDACADCDPARWPRDGYCGDGVCNADMGEHCGTGGCPADCRDYRSGGTRICCGNGTVPGRGYTSGCAATAECNAAGFRCITTTPIARCGRYQQDPAYPSHCSASERFRGNCPADCDDTARNVTLRLGSPFQNFGVGYTNVVAALNGRGAKVIGVSSCDGFDGTSCPAAGDGEADLNQVAVDTGSTDALGSTFVMDVSTDGTGVSSQLVDAVEDLANSLLVDVDVIAEDNPATAGVNEAGFLESVTASPSCPADCSGGAITNGCADCLPGTMIDFAVTWYNDIVMPTMVDQVFTFDLVVRGNGGDFEIDRIPVTIVVPAAATRYVDQGRYWRDHDATATCTIPPELPDWGTLTWEGATPSDSYISFEFQAADTAAGLAAAPVVSYTAPTASGSVDVGDVLLAAGVSDNKAHLRVTAVLHASSDNTASPTLSHMDLQYSCYDAE